MKRDRAILIIIGILFAVLAALDYFPLLAMPILSSAIVMILVSVIALVQQRKKDAIEKEIATVSSNVSLPLHYSSSVAAYSHIEEQVIDALQNDNPEIEESGQSNITKKQYTVPPVDLFD